MAIAGRAAAEPTAIFKWALRLSAFGFALQVIAVLLTAGLVLASVIPLFQAWAAERQVDAYALLLLHLLALLLYVPLGLTQEMRGRPARWTWRGVLARFPPVSRVLVVLGLGLLLFDLWLIPQWPRDLLSSATTPEARAAFQTAVDLRWVRVAAVQALASGLVWTGIGYQLRWLAHQR